MDKEIDIARAWKDEEHRNSLTPEQVAKLPPNPVGGVEMNEEDLENVNGGVVPVMRVSKTAKVMKTDW